MKLATMRRAGLMLPLLLAVTGCATMSANRVRQYQRDRAAGPTGPVAVLRLQGFRIGDTLYADGRRLELDALMSDAEIRSAADLCRFVYGPGTTLEMFVNQCGTFLKIGVFLDRSRPHTIRVARNGAEFTRTVRATWRFKWFWIDGLFGPGAFAAWAVDASSGAWHEFGTLDLTRGFAASAGTR